jgi:hypothetical protein
MAEALEKKWTCRLHLKLCQSIPSGEGDCLGSGNAEQAMVARSEPTGPLDSRSVLCIIRHREGCDEMTGWGTPNADRVCDLG